MSDILGLKQTGTPTLLALQMLGATGLVASGAGLTGTWDDAAMARVAEWVDQTNPYYDGMRIWISLLILSLFVFWAADYIRRHYGSLSGLPVRSAPFTLGASVAVTPVYLFWHQGWAPIPDIIFQEDGVMEYLTVALLIIASGMTVFAALRPRFVTIRPGRFPFSSGESTTAILIAVALFFLAMEELSWGQRLLGLDTPEILKEHNVQGELNLHNLAVGWNEIFRMAVACLLSTVLLLLPRDAVPGFRGVLRNLKPDGRLIPIIPLLIASHLYDEWFEQIVSFMIVSYAYLLFQRSRPKPRRMGARRKSRRPPRPDHQNTRDG